MGGSSQHRAASAGFTAVEAIFAVMILSLGLLGYLTLFTQMTGSTVNDEITLAARRLASEKIEQLVADKATNGYASIALGTTDENINYASHDFTRQTLINYVQEADLVTVSASDTGFKRIEVTVGWSTGTAQNVQMTSVLSSY